MQNQPTDAGAARAGAQSSSSPTSRRRLDPVRDLGLTVHFREEDNRRSGEYRPAIVTEIQTATQGGYPLLSLQVFGTDDIFTRRNVPWGDQENNWLFVEDRISAEPAHAA